MLLPEATRAERMDGGVPAQFGAAHPGDGAMSECGIEGNQSLAFSERDQGGAPALVAHSAVAVSGFLMGLVVRGEGTLGLAVAVLTPAMVWTGWWLRGASGLANSRARR